MVEQLEAIKHKIAGNYRGKKVNNFPIEKRVINIIDMLTENVWPSRIQNPLNTELFKVTPQYIIFKKILS